MLDLKLIRHSMDDVAARLKTRGVVIDTAKLAALEEKRKAMQVEMQTLQNERNVRSKEVGMAKAAGNDVAPVLKSLKELSDTLKLREEQFAVIQTELDDFLARIPNLPHESVPVGKSEEDNQFVRKWGEPKQFSFKPKDHVEYQPTYSSRFHQRRR